MPADIWSSGIVLVAMLTGELPWATTTDDNEEFDKWKKEMYLHDTPWKKLGNTALSLAKQMLTIEPDKRLTIEKILKHPWMKFTFVPGEFYVIYNVVTFCRGGKSLNFVIFALAF